MRFGMQDGQNTSQGSIPGSLMPDKAEYREYLDFRAIG